MIQGQKTEIDFPTHPKQFTAAVSRAPFQAELHDANARSRDPTRDVKFTSTHRPHFGATMKTSSRSSNFCKAFKPFATRNPELPQGLCHQVADAIAGQWRGLSVVNSQQWCLAIQFMPVVDYFSTNVACSRRMVYGHYTVT
ncbi:hypothetical protein PT974_03507 [Cladobotryum mycophilum]|uniref:Uncharacterized protein n=1 Tax=Cladobotryum mycophilum TaxID=491253 RepID=A0ABR0SSI4_9HYPO